MTNAEIARVLERLAVMLELEGANVFRVRAYREAGRLVGASGESMAALAAEAGALEALPGIGKDLAQKIRDLVATGSTELYRDLQKKFPLSVVELTELHGLGPKRVGTLFEVLGVRNRDDLEKAARAGKLRDLPGFGEKVEQNVLKALATASEWSGRVLLAAAWPIAEEIAARVRAVKGVTQVELAGSFRRRKETVGDLDVLVTGGHPDDVMEAFIRHPSVAEVLGRGETKSSVRLAAGLQADLRHVPEASFGAALLYFTGSKEHNIELRRIAIEKGMSLNEYGLTRGEKTVASRTEEDVYRALGAAWIPPELRESHGEIERARFGRLPDLLELADLRADLHMHSNRSDGRHTLDAMVEAAIARGHEYMAITEHSKALPMTNGFDEARVRQSVTEIAELRGRFPGMPILHGLEVDILADGALDLDDETLDLLDWVIVSIHSRFDQPPEVATGRALRALSNPRVHAFGHPTGRLIGSREPVAFDVERVATEAARRGVLMEINASPDRLDLNDANARVALAKGCGFVVDTDAHATTQLDQLRFGVFQARRAGLTKDDVWNARGWESFSAWLEERRARRGATIARPDLEAPARESVAKPAVRRPAKATAKPAGRRAAKSGAAPERRPAASSAATRAAKRPAKPVPKPATKPARKSRPSGTGRPKPPPSGKKK